LVAGGGGYFDGGDEAAAGAVDGVDAFGFELFGEFDGVVNGPAALVVGPVGAGEADEEGEVVGPDGADFLDGFAEEAGAVEEGVAIGVGAVVGEGGEEFVDKVAVGGVEFEEFVAGGEGAGGGVGELLLEGEDFGGGEFVGGLVVFVEGDCGGGDDLPAALGFGEGLVGGGVVEGAGGGGFSAGVGELEAGGGAVLFEEAGDAGEGFDLGVLPEAGIIGRDAAFGGNGGRLGHHQAVPPHGARSEVDKMPVGGVAVVRGVHAHGRNAEAVAEGDGTEGEGVEDGGHERVPW
jgi:hypothetical protein